MLLVAMNVMQPINHYIFAPTTTSLLFLEAKESKYNRQLTNSPLTHRSPITIRKKIHGVIQKM